MKTNWHYYINDFYFHKGRLYVDPHRASYGTEQSVLPKDIIDGDGGMYEVLRQPLESETFVTITEAIHNGIIREVK